jgi:uncharacterized damage-inducible protein DinB
MDAAGVLLELFGRIPPLAEAAVSDASPDQLTAAPGPGTNTIAWLVWHAARVQDDHVAELMGTDQVWASGGWAPRFSLAEDPQNTGYGHGPEEVRAVVPSRPEDLLEYLDAVQTRTCAWLATLTEGDLDEVVDRRWDPPVTCGVRLVSVADDSLQHLGQAAFLRGLLARS